ncbi:unnamed protein product, partial [marine sediment metagenome]
MPSRLGESSLESWNPPKDLLGPNKPFRHGDSWKDLGIRQKPTPVVLRRIRQR